MAEHDFNAQPLFTLRLGAAGKTRPAEDVMVNLIREAGFEAFSLAETKGWFRGEADPGWAITIAHDDHERVAQLAEALRRGLGQEGVGVEAFGRYLRSRGDHGPDLLAAELWGLRYGFHPAYYRTVFATDAGVTSWPASFAIVTAFATTGEVWSAERNAQADRALQARLEARGGWMARITGASPDGVHAEPGWAADLSQEEARVMGQDFQQDAVYSVHEGQLRVVACADGRMAPVAAFASRVKT